MRKSLVYIVASFMMLVGFVRTAPAEDRLSKDDKDVIKDAMRNLEAIAWESRLARTNSDNDRLQKLAEQIVGGHDKLISQLRDLGNKYNFAYDANPTKGDIGEKKDLEKLKGSKFDREYLDNMVKQHEELLGIFKKGAKSDNKDLREWFDNKQVAIRDHLDSVKKLQRDMKD